LETLKKMKVDLIEFHRKFDSAIPSEKIRALVDMQSRQYRFKNRIPLKVRRKSFENNPRNRRFLNRTCFVCGWCAEVRHHIISLKQGGTSGKKNIVALCRYDHALIHPWLKNGEK